MDTSLFSSILQQYEGLLSLYAFVGIIAVSLIGKQLMVLIPAFKQTQALNKAAAEKKMSREYYAANQKKNRSWGRLDQAVIFILILPFCLTLEAQPWWNILLDVVVILMFYDFFYYLVHRFLFHDGGFLGGPLMWVHAVHHQQNNPCRQDSSYIHPLEVALGLGLYAASIFVLSRFMGSFHVATLIISWVAFSEINLHNHDLMEADRFPYKYLKYMSKMHHVHHAKFTGGNYATISLFYDWLFGTYDTGEGYKKAAVINSPAKPAE
jgi:sterol desaturase/sphingolipid hydroxylase (fatty acid hydroxylase superfamily)